MICLMYLTIIQSLNLIWYQHNLLVGALSLVNHKGLHQGRTQTSIYLQVINFTSHHTTSHGCCCWFFLGYYIQRALSTRTCIRQGDLSYSAGLHRNHVLATANAEEIGRAFGNYASEWTGRVEISHSPCDDNMNHSVPDRSPPGSTRTAPSAVHQDGSVKYATGASSKIRGRDTITIGTWNTRTLRPAGKLQN